jgi:hypothetical protein
MTDQARLAATIASDLLSRYSFDLGAFSSDQLVDYWLRRYPADWVRAAVVEALYQGRYKAISVGQILAMWARRNQPFYHFNGDFERMVLGQQVMIPLLSQRTQVTPVSQSHLAGSTVAQASQESEGEPIAEPVAPHDFAVIRNAPAVSRDRPLSSDLDSSPPGSPEIWARNDVAKHPIHRFVPEPEGSVFYVKLRAVAHDEAFPEPPAELASEYALTSEGFLQT